MQEQTHETLRVCSRWQSCVLCKFWAVRLVFVALNDPVLLHYCVRRHGSDSTRCKYSAFLLQICWVIQEPVLFVSSTSTLFVIKSAVTWDKWDRSRPNGVMQYRKTCQDIWVRLGFRPSFRLVRDWFWIGLWSWLRTGFELDYGLVCGLGLRFGLVSQTRVWSGLGLGLGFGLVAGLGLRLGLVSGLGFGLVSGLNWVVDL